MNLEVRKLNFIQEFIQLQNEDIVKGLEKVLFESKVNLIETNISPMSLEQFNKEIDDAIKDSKNNKVSSLKNLKETVSKWS